jgi:predicted tellurium resistance membrane protein TerC
LLLFWIGVKLLLPTDDDHGSVDGSVHLIGAIKTIIIADAVMSLDNVIAVAGAAHGNIVLVTFGILVSVPIIVWGSRIVLRLMDRFPMVITIGAALLGWIAGGMLLGDVVLRSFTEGWHSATPYIASALGAGLVVLIGKLISQRHARKLLSPTQAVSDI